ncbi:MAG: phosphocholine cytidylyltransferase family protein [Gammaproteobacteria bacterium PRO9]|nr:phosphocholine cytidylyltransferase family protein [Gammaproteobacteria bacterium PRO9]
MPRAGPDPRWLAVTGTGSAAVPTRAAASVRSAVILAAGRGTRLAGHTGDRPKGFLKLGARTIIEESIGRLEQAGIDDVLIVTGHCAGHYETLAADRPGLVRTVHNPRFAESGSMYSLYCARTAIAGAFLLLESDLVYEPRALDCLLRSAEADAILLSGPTGAGDEVYVEAPGGRLRNMSKQRTELGSVAGELVGISRISPALYARMCGIAEQAFRSSLRYDYETDCLVAAAREQAIACLLVPDLVWGEIDDPSHLERVRTTVYPEVQRRSPVSADRP